MCSGMPRSLTAFPSMVGGQVTWTRKWQLLGFRGLGFRVGYIEGTIENTVEATILVIVIMIVIVIKIVI